MVTTAVSGVLPGSTEPSSELPDDPAELKKTWLHLLSKEKVIEIIFKFEECATEESKARIWPDDLSLEIRSLRGEPVDDVSSGSSDNSTETQVTPDTPTDEAAKTTPTNAAPESTGMQAEAAAPSPSTTPATTPAPAAASASAGEPAVVSMQPTLVPPPQPYPHAPYYSGHQPYGYTPPVPMLPMTPPAAPTPPPPAPEIPPAPQTYKPPTYSQQPWASYSHYPHYPGYPPYPPPQAPPAASTPPGLKPPFTSAPLPLQRVSQAAPPKPSPANVDADDLPSYEEMIVEALTQPQFANDPQGTAPKDVFAWMESRYPVQTNFRPSAAQALQKAYKRGRLEKSDGGKYRLNKAWAGGMTTRRNTRRPQSTNPHAAAVTPSPTPWPHPIPYTPPPQTQPEPPAPPPMASLMDDGPPHDGSVDATEAWEAAQSILKALNLSSLQSFMEQPSPEPPAATLSAAPTPAASTSTAVVTPESQRPPAVAPRSNETPFPLPIFAADSFDPLAPSSSKQPAQSAPAPEAPESQIESESIHAPDVATALSMAQPLGYAHGRAALQGHLALLAAQLADIAGHTVPGVGSSFLTASI